MKRSRITFVLVLILALGTVAQSQDPAANLPTDTATEIESLRAELETLRQQVQRRSVSADDLLAPPVDPERFNRDNVVEAGDFRGAILLPGTDVSLRIDGDAGLTRYYDTGFVGSGIRLFPATIALDQSPLAQRRGKTTLTGAQSRLSFDAQAKTEIGRLRGFVELDFLENELRSQNSTRFWRVEAWRDRYYRGPNLVDFYGSRLTAAASADHGGSGVGFPASTTTLIDSQSNERLGLRDRIGRPRIS